MEELERILREHAERYPKMQPTDAVKLIYQNAFGGGHLIRDEQACLEHLRTEYAEVEKDAAIPLCEDIGNGIVRVGLAAVPEDSLDRLGKDFIRSAAEHKGDLDSFIHKLAVRKKDRSKPILPYEVSPLRVSLLSARMIWILTLQTMKKAGYPVVSHSQQYRNEYKPAYRLVLSKNATL